MADFGFDGLGLSAADFAEPGQVIQLGYPPNCVDLLTAAAGVNFADCYARRVVMTIDAIEVNCIDVEGLKANKRATGRLQDLADVETLDLD